MMHVKLQREVATYVQQPTGRALPQFLDGQKAFTPLIPTTG